MRDQDKLALSKVRLDRAEECFAEAESLFASEKYRGAANRLYYSIFHAMRAVLALDGIDMKHHSGVISEFRRRYIKTNICFVVFFVFRRFHFQLYDFFVQLI